MTVADALRFATASASRLLATLDGASDEVAAVGIVAVALVVFVGAPLGRPGVRAEWFAAWRRREGR